MNKKTKIWLGVGVAVVAAGYLFNKFLNKSFRGVAGLEFNECKRNRDCPPNRPVCAGITSGNDTGRCIRQIGSTNF